MKKLIPVLISFLITFQLITATSYANSTSELETKAQLSTLLTDFLANKVGDDFKNHNRFWADDLIYTSSAGLRFDKSFIINGITNDKSEQVKEDEQTITESTSPTYSAESIDIRVFGTTAIVAFKLVAETVTNTEKKKQYYYNTGTFLFRDNKWQAVAWQATVIPENIR